MSYIDTFNHEYIGVLNGLPIYHPLEIVQGDKSGGYDFSCSPENLVLGGGSGEHPGLVIHHLERTVAQYLLFDIERKREFFSDRGYVEPSVQIMDRLTDIGYPCEDADVLEFCGWQMSDTHKFVEDARSGLNNSPLKEKQSVEDWILLSVGQLVYFSLGELNPHQQEMDAMSGPPWNVGYWMSNVMCPPPNHIKSKKKSMTDSSFKYRGFFRWDYQYPPEEK